MKRLFFYFVVVILFAFVSVCCLFSLSIFDSGNYRKEVDSRKYHTYHDVPKVGEIYDRNGRVLVRNGKRITVKYNKKAVKYITDNVVAYSKIKELKNNKSGHDALLGRLALKSDVDKRYSGQKSRLGLFARLILNHFNAVSRDDAVVYTDDEAVQLLAGALGKTAASVRGIIYGRDKDKITSCVVSDGSEDIYSSVAGLSIHGINAEVKKIRDYPENELAAGLLGLAEKSGFELYYDEELRGEPGVRKAYKHKDGKPVKGTEVVISEKRESKSFYLTIDANIQGFAEDALRKMAETYTPEMAMAVVMDPSDGEILAMANYPSFNPNNPKIEDARILQNMAVVNAYEPGSTMKAFTVAAAINEGVGPDEYIGNCSGIITIGTRDIHCDLHGGYLGRGHGRSSCRMIIQESCNIGASYLADRLGADVLMNYFDKFGLTSKPSSEFGHESSGYWTSAYTKTRGDLFSLSFGQGDSTTILNMAAGYCALANGGVYYSPKLIKKVVWENGSECKTYIDANGHKRRTDEQDFGRRVISEETSRIVSELLEGCIQNGTGKNARIAGVRCAGKTGSAQMSHKRKYNEDRMSSFIGYAPLPDPQFVVAVWVVKPHGSTYGSTVAAPVWKDIMQKTLFYRKTNDEQ